MNISLYKTYRIIERHILPFILVIVLATFTVHCLIYWFASSDWDTTSGNMGQKRHGLFVTYLIWWYHLLTWDMGTSMDGESVYGKVKHHIGNTLKLAFGALAISFLVSAAIGFWQAFKSKSWLARSTTFFISVLSCIPLFLLGFLIRRAYMRTQSNFPMGSTACLLAILTLGIGDGAIGEMARHLSDSAKKVLSREFMVAIRARNVPIRKHFWRNMSIPILDIISSRFALLISATIVVEYVFNYEGIGWLTLRSVQMEGGQPDYHVVMATTFVMVFIVALAQLTCGLLRPAIDKRLNQD